MLAAKDMRGPQRPIAPVLAPNVSGGRCCSKKGSPRRLRTFLVLL